MKIINLMIIIGTLLLMVVFNGCSNENKNVALDFEDCAYITVSVSDESARATLLPTPLTFDELSYVLKGRKSSESAMTQLGSWASYVDLQRMPKIELTTGDWNFTLEASKEDTVVLTSTISKSIEYGNNFLLFILNEASTGNGSLNVSLNYPSREIAKVTAGLLDSSGIWVYNAQNLTVTTNDGISTVTYNKTSVAKGVYTLYFYFYQNASDPKYKSFTAETVYIAPGCVTSGELSLNEEPWNDDFYIPLSYTNYTLISLPITSFKNDAVFVGWSDSAGFTGQKVTEIPLGNYGNKTYYEKCISGLNLYNCWVSFIIQRIK